MYSEVSNASLNIYDGETGNYIGEARFTLSTEAAAKLLDLFNYGKVPDSLLLLDVNLYHPSSSYIPPEPYQLYKRKAILRALFTDASTREQVPYEIRMTYDTRARGNLSGNLYYFDSVELNNINIADIQKVIF